jgi:hypothetical protein
MYQKRNKICKRTQAKILKNLCTHFLLFFLINYLPYHISETYFHSRIYFDNGHLFNDFFDHVFNRNQSDSKKFLPINSCLNPVALFCISPAFRRELKRYLNCYCKTKYPPTEFEPTRRNWFLNIVIIFFRYKYAIYISHKYLYCNLVRIMRKRLPKTMHVKCAKINYVNSNVSFYRKCYVSHATPNNILLNKLYWWLTRQYACNVSTYSLLLCMTRVDERILWWGCLLSLIWMHFGAVYHRGISQTFSPQFSVSCTLDRGIVIPRNEPIKTSRGDKKNFYPRCDDNGETPIGCAVLTDNSIMMGVIHQ